MGNLIAHTNPGGRIKIGLIAHADEIGIQITEICEPGIARFRKIGGLRATSLIGQRVRFDAYDGNTVEGVIGCDPMQDNGTDNGILVRTSDLWVDIGAESEAEFTQRLHTGDYGTFAPLPMAQLSSHRYLSKSVDDRIGLAAAIRVIESLKDVEDIDIILISSVQEELSLYGAKGIDVKPDCVIVVDVDYATDTPSDLGKGNILHLGKGIGLCMNADNSPVLLRDIKEVCKNRNLPYQLTVGRNFSGGTDAAAMRLKNATPCLNVNIPLRYMHTAGEVFDIRDVGYAISAVEALIRHISSNMDKDYFNPWK